MRNIRAEKKIEKTLAGRFFLDPAKYDVTVIGDHAEITGEFINRTSQQPLDEMQIREIQRFFRSDTVEEVKTYYYHLHERSYF